MKGNYKMNIQAISFTGKTPKMPIDRKAYDEALARVLGQSEKDYFRLNKKVKNEQQDPATIKKFLEQAKKFFAWTFPQ